MDPGANLREQYALALRILSIVDGHESIGELEDNAARLAELVIAQQQ